uniref:Receptor-like serine/threonine-protein kinase n=1 Tax=Araucaria cunninghamii TaxID=56994 RepID=A0A0D6QTN1_ARACU
MSIAIYFILFVIGSIVTEGAVDLGTSLKPSTTEYWQSPGKNFSFGFYPSGNSGLYVVGITFSAINDTTLLWSAGNDGGIKVDEGGSLDFQTDGNLVLRNGTQILWQTETANRSVASAIMQDDGNFVIKNRSSANVWGSFEHPTDTLVIDQKFNRGQTLRSGPYFFKLENSGNFTLKWKSNITYWNQGAPGATVATLNNQGIFKLFNDTADSLWMARSSDYTDNSITLRRITLESDGNLRSYGWVRSSGKWQLGWSAVEDQCQVYGWCGNFGVCVYNETGPFCQCPSGDFVQINPNDPTGGCRRTQDIMQCSNNQSMVELDHTEFFSYPPESESDSEIYYLGIPDCWQNCLKNPSCTASTIMADGSGTCRMKTSNFTSAYQSVSIPSTSYVKVCGPGKPLPPSSSSLKTRTKWKVSGVVIAVAVIAPVIGLIALQFGLWWIFCRHNPRFRFGELPAQYTLLEYASGAPVQFSYRDLQRCTKNFTEKVGSGGFGTVYKGELSNKATVAVKQLEGIEQGEKQFRMEVAAISSTHHLNLVRLVGFCSEGRHRLLVYEFMKNSSLDTFLFNPSDQSKTLDWDTRFSVAAGTAKGIAYLHEECRDCIVHCDIKPENILLNSDFRPKVADFGLTKLVGREFSTVLTTTRGTRGYVAPEWIGGLPITAKADVYSFGMTLLEIISGRRNMDADPEWSELFFPSWAAAQINRENFMALLDKKLKNSADLEQLRRTAMVGGWCIQDEEELRPSMSEVVQILQGTKDVAAPPIPRTLLLG